MKKKYLIKKKGLGFRLVEKGDIDYLFVLESDPEVQEFSLSGAKTYEQTEAVINEFISDYEEKGLPCFMLFELESNEFVGRAGFGVTETGDVEVGYVLHQKFWGNGYATEVLTTLLKWAKQNINVDYIIALTPVAHIASQHVMQKCGMEHYKNDFCKDVTCCFYRIRNK